MIEKWQNIQLKEVTTKIGSGATPRGGQSNYKISGTPFIRSLNIYDLSFNYDDLAFIDDKQAKSLSNVEVLQEDVLLNITGASVCRCTSVPDGLVPARVNQHVSIIRADGVRLIGGYLKYVLVSPFYKKMLYSIAITGATREALTKSDIEDFEIKIPTVNYQKKIVSILSAYDALIDNNEKRIKILEEMAQRLYTEWFVKFRFPGCEKVTMIDSKTEYGLIPDGWRISPLKDLMDFVRGRSYSTEQVNEVKGDYYLVNLKSFNRGGGFRRDGERYYTGPVNKDQILRSGDVVLAVTDMTNDRAVIARPARIPKINCNITFSADVIKIMTGDISQAYVYHLMLDYRFTEKIKNKANGANVLHLKPASVMEYRAIIPPLNLLNSYQEICDDLYEFIDNATNLIINIKKIRDLLVPQLVTGRRNIMANEVEIKS